MDLSNKYKDCKVFDSKRFRKDSIRELSFNNVQYNDLKILTGKERPQIKLQRFRKL